MARGYDVPTRHRRQLGRALRETREQRGMTMEQVCAVVGKSVSWLSRVEGGTIRVRAGAVMELCEVYDVAPDQRRELVRLARQQAQEGWWVRYGERLSRPYLTYIALESEASAALNWEPTVIPGLLQTEAYATEILRTRGVDIKERLDVRMRRQAQITRDATPLRLWAVMDESVLRREVGGAAVMAEQLDALAAHAERANVTVQVVPFRQGAHVGISGSFAILRFAEEYDRDVAYLETALGDMFREVASEVDALTDLFRLLCAVALSPSESITMVRRIADEYRM